MGDKSKTEEDMIVHKDLNIYNIMYIMLRALMQSLLAAFLPHLQFWSLFDPSCR